MECAHTQVMSARMAAARRMPTVRRGIPMELNLKPPTTLME